MRALIAEDDATSRLMLKRVLSKWGYTVEEAEDGGAAWDILQREDSPPLAVLDWMMPGMDGLEVCRRVRRAEGGDQRRYVVMLTARSSREDLVHALDTGADDYVVKPFDPQELKVRLRAGERLLLTQQHLRQSQENQESLLDALAEGVMGLDKEGVTTFVNPAACRLLGYESSELVGRNNHHLLHHSHKDGRPYPQTECPISLVLTDGQPRQVESDIFWRKDGSAFDVSYRTQPCQDRQGRLQGAVVTFSDVTERLWAQQRLDANRRYTQEILETANILILGLDESRRLTYVNRKVEDVLGWPRQQLVDRQWEEFIQGQRSAPPSRHKLEPDSSFETTVQTREKFQRTISWRLSRVTLPESSAQGYMAFGLDITEQRQAEEALRRSEERWHYALEGSGEGVWDWQPQKDELFLSARCKELMGYSVETSFDGWEAWMGLVHPKDHQQLQEALQGHLQGEQGQFQKEFRLRRGDATYMWVQLRGRVMEWSATGEPLRVIGTLADITERKRLEDELQYQATRDLLTGCYNRLKFEAYLEQKAEEANRYGHPLSLIMFDIDHFKQVNDNYGHDVGDEVLKGLVELVRQQMRRADLLARWGGEEFMIMAAETPCTGALELAEKLRRRVAAESFEQVGKVTISLGVAAYHRQEPLKNLLKRVDDALYQAKEQGRNRVVAADQKDCREGD